jgi:hypothetical protein
VKKSFLGSDAGCENANGWTTKRNPLVQRIRHATRASSWSTGQKQPKTTFWPFFGRVFRVLGHFCACLSDFLVFA